MIKRRRWTATALLLASAAVPLLSFTAGAQDADHVKQVAGKFMCMCGCNQVLSQCNHVGCTTSTAMLKEVDQSLKRGDSENTITQMFVQEFGTKVYAEPPTSGFSLVAWAMPGVYLVLGLLLVVFVISRWRKRPTLQPAGASHSAPVSSELLQRARAQAARDTED